MNAINKEPEHQEIEALLPWYAAGTLSRRDANRVEQALAGDRELARQYDLVREELVETIHLNETLGAPSPRAMERLFAAIDAEAARAPRHRRWPHLGSRAQAASPRRSGGRKRSERALGKCNRNRMWSTSSPRRSKAKRVTGCDMAATSRICSFYPRLRTKNCHTRDVWNRLLQQLKPL